MWTPTGLFGPIKWLYERIRGYDDRQRQTIKDYGDIIAQTEESTDERDMAVYLRGAALTAADAQARGKWHRPSRRWYKPWPSKALLRENADTAIGIDDAKVFVVDPGPASPD